MGIASAGLIREFDDSVPEHLQAWWTPDLWCLHSATWWRRHWERAAILDVDSADTLPDGWRLRLDWHMAIASGNHLEIAALEADRGRHLGYVRVTGRRRQEVPVLSVATQYAKMSLVREPS